MKTSLLPLVAVVGMGLFGCSAQRAHSATPMSSASLASSPATHTDSSDKAEAVFTDTASAGTGRTPGDFVVTEITMGAHKAMTLTQKVLADGSVEYSLKDGAKTETFRIRMRGEEAVSAVRVEGGVERPSTVAAYDAMMQRTVPEVDRNDGEIDSRTVVVELDGKTAEATLTRYRVLVGGKPATMSVTRVGGFGFGDVAGEITGAAGKLVYRARVIDVGSAGSHTSVATK